VAKIIHRGLVTVTARRCVVSPAIICTLAKSISQIDRSLHQPVSARHPTHTASKLLPDELSMARVHSFASKTDLISGFLAESTTVLTE
jgi:hypothetical protein